jgi:hypothetical protein
VSVLSAQDEFDQLSSRSTAQFTARVLDLVEARAAWHYSLPRIELARESLGRLIAGTYSVAEMLGRRRVLLEADKMSAGMSSYSAMQYAADQNLIPHVSPERAIEDMVKREPRLAHGYKEVQEIYSFQRAFALAKSSDQIITEKVQSFLAASLGRGGTLPTAEKVIAGLGDWSRAYGETVFRTNMGTAYASGRIKESMDPDLSGFIVGLERQAVNDVDTRKNHRAASGLCAAQRDPIWLRLGLPAGYSCRCNWRLVDIYEARRRRLMDGAVMRQAKDPAGAYNDPGFDNRVNFSLYGL